MDWKTLLAPFVGAGAAWLASKGFTLTADQQAALMTIVAGALTGLAHWFDTKSSANVSGTNTGSSAPPPKQGGYVRLGWLAFGLAPLAALLLLVILPACSSLGLSTAQSFDEQLAYAYGTHTAVEQAAASAVNAHSITAAEGQAVLSLGDQARALLDSAKAVETTNATGATKDLVLATAVLQQLQQYLQERGVK